MNGRWKNCEKSISESDGSVPGIGVVYSRSAMRTATRADRYRALLEQIDSVLDGEDDPLVWMSTLPVLAARELGFLWVGFYVVRGEELRVGPYRGELGCLRIPFDRGVCGACATRRETLIVPDVHRFEGHIACDSRAESEIVVPVFDSDGRLRAVLDVDSDRPADFGELDRVELEALAALMKDLAWDPPS